MIYSFFFLVSFFLLRYFLLICWQSGDVDVLSNRVYITNYSICNRGRSLSVSGKKMQAIMIYSRFYFR